MATPTPQKQGKQDRGFSFRSDPLLLLKQDIGLILANFPLLPHILLPLHTLNQLPSAELAVFQDPLNLFAILNQIVLFIASLVAFNGTFVLIFLGTPALLVAAWVVGWIVAFSIEKWLTQGQGKEPGIIRPSKHKDWEKEKSRHDETWLYVNGICSGRHWVQESVDMLSQIFKRNITGVHNRTSGFFFDIVECLLQREWIYGTQDAVPLLYKKAKDALLSPDQKKVVIIAHSQGGIILTLVVDWLLADLSESALRKLEIYTFASAANHFNSPKGSDGQPVIQIVEHFCNGLDPVARIGALAWQETDGNKCKAGEDHARFFGKLFHRPKASGHLLNQHYLQSLSPQESWPVSTQGEEAHLWSYIS